MASLDILCSNPLKLKNKVTKIEHKKIFCGLSEILKNISRPVNICLKYFTTPTKILRSAPPSLPRPYPTCLIYGPLTQESVFSWSFNFKANKKSMASSKKQY